MSAPGASEQLQLLRAALPTAPRGERQRPDQAAASTDPVASVVVDTGLPHLDRPFEYLVLRQSVGWDEAQRPPPLGDLELGLDQGPRGPSSHQLLERAGVTGHRDDLQLVIGLQKTDRGDAKADHVSRALDDQVEQVLQTLLAARAVHQL